MNKNTIKEWKNTDTAGDGCSDVKIFQSQGSLAARDNDPPCATPIGSHFERSHLGRGTVYMRSQAVRQVYFEPGRKTRETIGRTVTVLIHSSSERVVVSIA